MGRPLTKTGSSLAHGAALALLTLGLVACGVTPQSTTEVTPPVPLSPAAGEIPEERTQASATITEDGLDPDRFAGQIETGFTLTITGDGEEHTLVIQDLVAETAIAADGETSVTFTVAGDPGVSNITLDGDVVGAFERQSAAGITSE